MQLRTIIVTLILNLPMLAWAQSGKPTKLDDLAAYNKPDREQVLYTGAKAEGKPWYTRWQAGRTRSSLHPLKRNIPASKWKRIVDALRARSENSGGSPGQAIHLGYAEALPLFNISVITN